MTDSPITVAGIVIPTNDPKFLVILAIHIIAGLVCCVAGATAVLSRKARGNHTRAGLLYYRSLLVVFATMSALAAMRWAHDYPLFILGFLSLSAAATGRRFVNHRSSWRIRGHTIAMGTSYVLLLVAFYVDNGRNLPFWRNLPHVTYWSLPLLLGAALIIRAVTCHPLAVTEHKAARVEPTGAVRRK